MKQLILIILFIFSTCKSAKEDSMQLFSLLNAIQSRQTAAATATTQTIVPKYAYSSSSTAGINQYSINSTTGILTSLGTASGVPAVVQTMVGDPKGRFIYMTNSPSNLISSWAINSSTGIISIVGQTTLAAATGAVVDPQGLYLYATSNSANTITTYSINQSTGAITFLSSTSSIVSQPSSIAIHPSGRIVYAITTGTNTIQAFTSIAGILTASSSLSVGTGISAPIIDPTGQFLYNGQTTNNLVSMYSINQTTGALTSLGTIGFGSNTGTGGGPSFIDPSGQFLYASASTGISIYRIGTTGALTLAGTAEASSANQPIGAYIDPSGKFGYVAQYGGGGIKMYNVSSSDGSLSLISGSTTISTLANPQYIITVGAIQ